MVNKTELEPRVQAALEEWTKTPGLAIREAARHHDVAESTLRRRLNGGTTARESHQWQQRVSPAQEEELARWYTATEARDGKAPNSTQIRQAAEEMLQSNGDYKPLGKHWHRSFVQRIPAIATLQAKRRDDLEKAGVVSKAMEDDDGNDSNPMPRPVTPEQAASDEPLIVTPKSVQDCRKLIARLLATDSARERRLITYKLGNIHKHKDRMIAETARLERNIERMRREIDELKKEEEEEKNEGKKRKRSKAGSSPIGGESISEGDFLERMGQDLRADTSAGALRGRSTRKVTKGLAK